MYLQRASAHSNTTTWLVGKVADQNGMQYLLADLHVCINVGLATVHWFFVCGFERSFVFQLLDVTETINIHLA